MNGDNTPMAGLKLYVWYADDYGGEGLAFALASSVGEARALIKDSNSSYYSETIVNQTQ